MPVNTLPQPASRRRLSLWFLWLHRWECSPIHGTPAIGNPLKPRRTHSLVLADHDAELHGLPLGTPTGAPAGPMLGPAPPRRYARIMCTRARLFSDVTEIKLVFSIPPHWLTSNIASGWNVAPTDPPGRPLRCQAGERSLDVMRWGLVPFLAKDIKVGFSIINAKARGIEGKPAFREAFQRRRVAS
jgi:hypothetical protein